MLSRSGRPFAYRVFGPIARLAVKAGITADAITITGTAVTVLLALTLYPLGHPVWASWLIGAVVIMDSLDGQVARLTHTSSAWGAFLDATCDRLADGAIFAGIMVWVYRYQIGATNWIMVGLLGGLVVAITTSYAKARAEASGYSANVGLSERADRLVILLAAAWLAGTGWGEWLTWLLLVAAWYLFVAGFITVLQRMITVKQQAVVGRGSAAGTETQDDADLGGQRKDRGPATDLTRPVDSRGVGEE